MDSAITSEKKVLPPDPEVPVTASIVALVMHWVSLLGARIKLISELALAEAKLAVISFMLMAFLAMLGTASVIGAWGFLMAALIYGLLQLGFQIWAVLLAVGGLHGLLAAVAFRGVVNLGKNLEFRQTLDHCNSPEECVDELAATTA